MLGYTEAAGTSASASNIRVSQFSLGACLAGDLMQFLESAL